MRIIYSLVISIFIFSACSTEEEFDASEVTNFTVSADTLVVSSEANDYIIGNARTIAIGPNKTVYVLDSIENIIKVFNASGEMVGQYLRGEGRGPGEVMTPTSFHVDDTGNIYVIDSTLNKVIILNSDNEPIDEFAFSMRPSKVLATHPDSVFILGFRFTYQGDLIQRYTKNENGDFEISGSMGERVVDSRDMNFSGWSDQLELSSNGTLLLTQFYPYHITEFDGAGNQLSEITREVEFMTPPSMDMTAGMVLSPGLTREPIALANGMLLIRYQDRTDSDNPKSYFDLYNAEGELLSTRSFDELGIGNDLTQFVSNPADNTIYALSNDPFPYIMQFQINFE